MSVFQKQVIACPSCSKPLAFETVYSINADRRPELRVAIVDGSFQRMHCPKCDAKFRLDCDFSVLDTTHGQWIAALPVARVGGWQEAEAEARAMFDRAYGAEAPRVAQQIGKKLKARVVFGWPALREKLLAADLGLDDLAVEACKAMAIRAGSPMPARAIAELRLYASDGKSLLFAWMRSYDGVPGDVIRIPRALHDGIAADAADVDGAWAEFRRQYDGALFVDLKRQLIKGRAAA